MGEFISQLLTLLHKNALLKGKSKIKIIVEVLSPLVVIGVLFGILYLTMIIKPDYSEHPASGYPFIASKFKLLLYGSNSPGGLTIYQQAVINNLQNQIAVAQNRTDPEICMKFFQTKQEMSDFFHDPVNYRGVLGGLWFEGDPVPGTPNSFFQYSISIDSDFVNDNSEVMGSIVDDSQIYLRHGFTQIQTSVDMAIIATFTGLQIPIQTYGQRFPDPYVKMWQKWIQGRNTIFLNFGGVFLTAAMFVCFYKLITDLVMEKESKILEGMKMMGLNIYSYYISHSISSIYTCIPSTLIICVVLLATQLIYTTPIVMVVVIFVLYSLTLLIMSFILSKFFDRSKFAGLISFLFILILSAIGVLVYPIRQNYQLLCSILSPIAFTVGIHTIASRDLTDLRAFNEQLNVPETHIISMLFADIFIYLIVLWYLDNIMTGQYGTRRPWYFLVTRSYWIKEKVTSSLLYDDEVNLFNNSNVEQPPLKKNIKISIKKLRKEFETGDGLRVAINDLSLNMYEGEIHAFLGPNGSGKSTTIGCLTGLIIPTNGTATIDGYDIRTQMSEIRKTIGVCSQQDILWPTLTVLEHLEIYASLKGITDKNQAKNEARFMAKEVGLGEKLDAPSSTLSGGQKRKLCLGIAFIGRSKVILVDEATSGMDPQSRRSVWDFLLKYKKGRTIVLTTHFMDEADYLGDRIGIISRGKLRCDGSSLFLKNRFGAGYLLTISKTNSTVDTKPIEAFICQYITEAAVLSNAATEISFRLPSSSIAKFSNMFHELDMKKNELYILHYGISVTTIEEVFLSIGEEEQQLHDKEQQQQQLDINDSAYNFDELTKKAINIQSKGITARQQLRGLLLKRIHTSRKDIRSFILGLLIPVLIAAAGVALLKNMTNPAYFNSNTTPLYMNISSLITPDLYVPYSVDATVDPLITNSIENSGIGKQIAPSDMHDYLEDNYENDPGAYSFSTAVTDKGQQYIESLVWYNRGYLHALPIYINLMSNSVLMYKSQIGISLISEPFEHILSPFEVISEKVNIGGIIFFIILILSSQSLIAASSGGNISQERSDQIKRLLYISGCKKSIYWLSNLIWDYALALVMVAFLSIVMIITNHQFRDNFAVFIVSLSLSTFSILPLSYLLSYLFKSHGKATGAIFGILWGMGLLFTVGNLIIRIFVIKNDDSRLQTIADIMDMVLYIFSPLYCFSKIITIITGFPGVQRLNTSYIDNYWALHYCGLPIFMLIGHCLVWTIWIMVLDLTKEIKGYFRSRFSKVTHPPPPPPDEDSDVGRERIRVENNPNELLTFKNLHKQFPATVKGNKPTVAVYNSTLSIPKGQTFGLLGLNGAGKSTTLSMLTMDILPTSGTVTINGYNLMKDRKKALQSVGFCPQHCSLVGLLSAREQLTLYCRIKGIDEKDIHQTVEGFIHMMDLGRIGNSQVSGYSGGNKRKVSLSIACIANPSLVILDEPSCGVDAQVRRFMWNVISELGRNKVIIITTHSMEECEALAERITIMREGKFTCLGSIQHVKSKYGSGYSIDVKLKKEYVDTGVNIIKNHLPGAILIDNHDLVASFELPNPQDNPIQLSKIFSTIQTDLNYLVDSYSVSQTSLEQVFLKLTGSRSELQDSMKIPKARDQTNEQYLNNNNNYNNYIDQPNLSDQWYQKYSDV
ncbi:ABC transporter A family protein [Tieghemostelium lacteum]|uniref:ABC transporter A family protein n=1 Tax=Tieghemostelium lacteum TaxID=361077 RepID=A0A152A4X9_TIELA|nr:ABC transporter A family protein [Tieghemostelium lacteum]|eukprot:KYR01293.1 ABC transporter A family protein [Tieghemostelium lacteum]